MTSETPARAGTLAGRWSWKRGQDEGKRSGGASVSTVLTLTPNRDCSPRKNRSIPTIPAGRTDVGPANVSAVDTGLAGVSPGFLRHGPAPPSQVRPRRSLPAACAGSGGQGSASAPPRVGPIWLELACSTRVGIYWPRVVRTARRPHLPEVPPTLLQWRPTLVQCIQATP